MIAFGQNTPNRYFINALTISNSQGLQRDVTGIFNEFQITESIYNNFLTGTIQIADGVNLFEQMGFSGQEFIRISFSGTKLEDEQEDYDHYIDQIFRIYKISDVIVRGSVQTYTLHFCSQEWLESKRKRVSRAYQGSLSDILVKVCEEYLKLDYEAEKNDSGKYWTVRLQSKPENYSVVIPNWTVQDTIRWLTSKMSAGEGEEGSSVSSTPNSYYFYQTARGGYFLNTISDMYNVKYDKEGKLKWSKPLSGTGAVLPSEHYDYMPKPQESPTMEIVTRDGVMDRQGPGYDIYESKKPVLFDISEATSKGVYSGKRITFNNVSQIYTELNYRLIDDSNWDIDPKTGKYKKQNMHLSEGLPIRTAPEAVMKVSSDGNAVGPEGFKAAGPLETLESIHDYTDAVIDFGYESPLHINGINDTTTNVHHNTKLSNFHRDKVRNILDANTMRVIVSGRTNINCGLVVETDIKIPMAQSGDVEVVEESMINGKFLVTKCTFIGDKKGLTCQLDLAKDGRHKGSPDNFEYYEPSWTIENPDEPATPAEE